MKLWRYVDLRLRAAILYLLVGRRVSGVDLVRLGTEYGGWWVPSEALTAASVCLSAGVGEDASFDLAVIERFGCTVVALDPTPRARAYVESLAPCDRFRFIESGLGGHARVARFYAPSDPRHVSHSMTNLQKTTTYFTAQVVTVADVLTATGLMQVDLLKLDIEGAEHEVIGSLGTVDALPSIVLVEFDQPDSLTECWRSVRTMRSLGYRAVQIERFNVTFMLHAGHDPKGRGRPITVGRRR